MMIQSGYSYMDNKIVYAVLSAHGLFGVFSTRERAEAYHSRRIKDGTLQLKGKIVDVYYNPNRPQRSMLEPGFSLSKLIYPGAGLLVLAVAFSLMAFGRQK